MSKILEYIDTLEKLLIEYMIKSKRNIKKTNKKMKDISILLAQQGISPEEINNCFDVNTYYYNKEPKYNSDDDGNNDDQKRESDLLNNTEVIVLSKEEQKIVHDNPIVMTKNLKKLFFEKNEVLKHSGLIERNKWSKVNNENEEIRLLHKKRKISETQ